MTVCPESNPRNETHDDEQGPKIPVRPVGVRVSVIIPAFNAREHLSRCIPALAVDPDARPDVDFEILVVDDRSTDGTAAVAESLGARVVRMQENGGPSRARNAGSREARGEFLFFVDADVVVHRGAIARVRSFLEGNRSVAAVFGSYDASPMERGVLTEYRNLLHHFVHQSGDRRASTFWSGCGAIRRDVFRQVGGFDETEHPRCIEDIELGYRLRAAGHEIALDPGLQCTHLKRWTVASWIGTDLFCRAIPWARLNLKSGCSPNDLNIALDQKISVFLTVAALGLFPAAVLHPLAGLAAAIAMAAVIGLNLRLFRFFCRNRGPTFALRCVPLHLVYFLYSGVGFAYAWFMHRIGLRPYDWNAPRG